MVWTPGVGNEYQHTFHIDMGYVVSFGSLSVFLFRRIRRVREQYLGEDRNLRMLLFSYGDKINEIADYLEGIAEKLGELEDGE